MFSICFLDSSKALILFFQVTVHQLVEKKKMKKDLRKIVEKMFEILAREAYPYGLHEGLDDFDNFGHKTGGMGYIDSDKTNTAYYVDSCCLELGLRYPSQMRKMKSS